MSTIPGGAGVRLGPCSRTRAGGSTSATSSGAFATGVTVVTSRVGDTFAGMTLNSFTSVSLDPLLVLVSLAHGTRTLEMVHRCDRFAVNVLHRRQRDVALAFAKPGAPFPDGHTVVDPAGYLVVMHALAILRCQVSRDPHRGRSRPRGRRGGRLRGIGRGAADLPPRRVRWPRRGRPRASRARDRLRRLRLVAADFPNEGRHLRRFVSVTLSRLASCPFRSPTSAPGSASWESSPLQARCLLSCSGSCSRTTWETRFTTAPSARASQAADLTVRLGIEPASDARRASARAPGRAGAGPRRRGARPGPRRPARGSHPDLEPAAQDHLLHRLDADRSRRAGRAVGRAVARRSAARQRRR